MQGFDTIIIPTGGTEQNGAHLILGKHNYIVRETSGRIAEALGRTFVAPVLSYVPEGDTGPDVTGHMRWPGTLSLSEPVFEAVLESAVRSYRAHGFTKIVFVGDSLGNQAGQATVASRLSEEWAADGILVASLSDYYADNGQMAYLVARGFSEEEIGGHAGIRDTSELLLAAPGGVRTNVIAPTRGWPTGASGDHSQASAEIGQQMISLKVAAAVRQFRILEKAHSQQARLRSK